MYGVLATCTLSKISAHHGYPDPCGHCLLFASSQCFCNRLHPITRTFFSFLFILDLIFQRTHLIVLKQTPKVRRPFGIYRSIFSLYDLHNGNQSWNGGRRRRKSAPSLGFLRQLRCNILRLIYPLIFIRLPLCCGGEGVQYQRFLLILLSNRALFISLQVNKLNWRFTCLEEFEGKFYPRTNLATLSDTHLMRCKFG
jgi:hypothetical protein